MYQAAQAIARRMEPSIARAFLASINRIIDQIDQNMLVSAVASGNLGFIEMAVSSGGNMESVLLAERTLERALLRTAATSGSASADILSKALGEDAPFNVFGPRIVLGARAQAGELIVGISENTRETIRGTVQIANELGLSIEEQARIIRIGVGLPPNWAQAPANLGDELRRGVFTSSRRMSAADVAQIRSRLANGTIDESFIAKMQTRYAASLTNLRAQTISRFEGLTASHFGQHESILQAVDAKALPENLRRYPVCVDDERGEHIDTVPDMNPDGRALDEEFESPEGPALNPPFRPGCRCGVRYSIPGFEGVL